MCGMSPWEMAVIAAVALLALGPKRIPELAKTVGKGLRELRRHSADLRSTFEEPLEEIRRPLDELRGDLMHVSRKVQQDLERETRSEPTEPPHVAPPPELDPYAAGSTLLQSGPLELDGAEAPEAPMASEGSAAPVAAAELPPMRYPSPSVAAEPPSAAPGDSPARAADPSPKA